MQKKPNGPVERTINPATGLREDELALCVDPTDLGKIEKCVLPDGSVVDPTKYITWDRSYSLNKSFSVRCTSWLCSRVRWPISLFHAARGHAIMPRTMDDLTWMRLALDEARAALAHDDVPIGAVIVRSGVVIARAHNRREVDGDPTAHAELLAIRAASQVIGHWRLEDVTLYCTLEPCAMCAGAMVLARLPRLVYAATDPKAGAGGSIMDILAHPQLNHTVDVTSGVLADEATALIREFFARLRAEGQK